MPSNSRRALRAGWLLALLALGSGAACSRGGRAVILAEPALAPSASASQEIVFTTTPQPLTAPSARWVFWPEDYEGEESVDLGDGTALYVGERGERWVAAHDGSRRAHAADFAPEPLIAARRYDERWIFVGRSGAAYAASSPLGALATVRAPKEPLVVAAAGKGAIVGLLADGRVVRSVDGGRTFVAAKVRKPAPAADDAGAPDGAIAPTPPRSRWDPPTQALAMSPRGVGVMALDRRAVFVTVDDGASFRPFAADELDELDAIGRDAQGDLLLRRSGGEVRRLGARGVLTKTADEPARVELSRLPGAPPPKPARLRSGGFDALLSARYVELTLAPSAPSSSPPPWRELVGSGRAPPPPRVPPPDRGDVGFWTQPLPEGPRVFTKLAHGWSIWEHVGAVDDRYVIGGYGALQHSTDAGAHFTAGAKLNLDQSGAPHDLWPLPSGAIILSGYCRFVDAIHMCTEHGYLYAPSPGGPFTRLLPSSLGGARVDRPVFDSSGTHVFALAQETRDEGAATLTKSWLIVSHDGARSFRVVPQGESPGYGVLWGLTVDVRDPKHPVLVGFGDEKRVRFSEDLATRTTTALPRAFERLAMAGARGLALAKDARRLFETADAGETWVEVERAPSERFDCVEAGCRFEGGAFRVGWTLGKRE